MNDAAAHHPPAHSLDPMVKAREHHDLLLENGSVLRATPIGPHYVENLGQTNLHILAVEVRS